MARKTTKQNHHDFTNQIHSTARRGTGFAGLKNWDERKAKEEKKVCCKDCRYYQFGCGTLIGAYHQTCEEFQWW